MHSHSFTAVTLATAIVLLTAAASPRAQANWSVGGDRGRHNPPQRSTITPPGPFLQINPDPYLYPQPNHWPQRSPQYQPPSLQPPDSHAWQEHQWRESQWQEHQQFEQEHQEWRDWGQHDRSDRSSRERESRDRDWQGPAGDSGAVQNRSESIQPDDRAARNPPRWGYREQHR